jgi:lipid-binding SYLF domain-containing protein
LYGKKIEAKDVVLNGAVTPPPSSTKLLSALDKASPKNKSGK